MEVSVLVRHGKSIREIAQGMGLSKKMVRKYPRQPEAVREYGPRPRRGSKPNPFKEGLRRRVAKTAPKSRGCCQWCMGGLELLPHLLDRLVVWAWKGEPALPG